MKNTHIHNVNGVVFIYIPKYSKTGAYLIKNKTFTSLHWITM